jgi:hypothetical protein
MAAMIIDVPPLSEWLRWIGEIPAAFRAEPEGFGEGRLRVRAVIADLFETLFGSAPPESLLGAFVATSSSGAERNRLGWVLAAAHVLWHPSMRGRLLPRAEVERFFVQELAALGAAAAVGSLDAEEERREELTRRALRACGLGLPGESGNDAEDRLRQVDSVERRRVLVAAAERERRAREVREAMARKAAEEAAAKVSRE